jgi:hypothetical protein
VPASGIICFRCRKPIGAEGGACPHCEAQAKAPAGDPEAVVRERSFLVERGIELTDPNAPAFMGLSENEILYKAERVPPLPIGRSAATVDAAASREKLLRMLALGDARERGLAAIRLADNPDPETVFALLKRLGDREPDVRVCILWSIGRSGYSLVLPPLLEFERMETDQVVRAQLAAALFRLASNVDVPDRKRDPLPAAAQARLEELDILLGEGENQELRIERGRLHIRAGALLKSLGDFSRCKDESGRVTPLALFYRSQSFLLLGKTLFALDDMADCPADRNYPALYYLHRATLIALAKQFASAARDRGLADYARLFERRLERLG